jgi:DNA-directed RNA polymerase specialized sigma24 family protein
MVTTLSSDLVAQHVLRRRAVDLRRRIYASLPWGYRLASLLLVLAGDALDAFGRSTYAEFIRAVVRGMPDTPSGKPAFDLIQDVERRGPDAVPVGYGRLFAARVYKILISKFADPEIAEEAMSQVLLQVARRKVHVANGATLQEAEALIITIALNAARDLLRSRRRRQERSLVRDDEDSQAVVEVEDPGAFERLDKLLPVSELRAVLRELEGIHPRAPEWLRARLNGDSGTEIAENWGTSPSYVSKWQSAYVPAIKKVVENRLRTAAHAAWTTDGAQPYSYDRRPSTVPGRCWSRER